MNAGKRTFLLAMSAVLLAWGGAAFAARGLPANIMRFPSQGIESMEYESYNRLQISIAIGKEGKVRDITRRTPSF